MKKLQHMVQNKQKALDFLSTLQPKEWNTDKNSVVLVEEIRQQRSGYLSNNKKFDSEVQPK